LSNDCNKKIQDMLCEESLVLLQNQIVDQRFAATGLRDFQNYIGQTTLNYDEAKELMKLRIDIPDKLIDSFIRFTHQNSGIFPKRRRSTFIC